MIQHVGIEHTVGDRLVRRFLRWGGRQNTSDGPTTPRDDEIFTPTCPVEERSGITL